MTSRWKNLSFRLPMVFLLFSLVPLLGFGLLATNFSKGALVEFQTRASHRTALQAGLLIEKSLSEAFEDLATAGENMHLHTLHGEDLRQALASIRKQQPEILSLTVLDGRGGVLMKSSTDEVLLRHGPADWSQEPAFIAAMAGDKHKGPAEALDGGGFKIQLAVPLTSSHDEAPSGVLVSALPLHHLVSGVTDLRIGQEGLVYIIDKRGEVIAHPDADFLRQKESVYVNALTGVGFGDKAETSARYINLQGVEVLGVTRPVSDTNWLVVAELPMSELQALENQLQRILVFLLLSIFAMGLPLIYVFLRSAIRPLKRLEQGAAAIGAGRFNEKIPVTSDNEISRVTNAFNQMAEQLQNFLDDAKRTSWLQGGLTGLDDQLRGSQSLAELSQQAITYVAEYVNAPVGALYVNQADNRLVLSAGHAHQANASTPTEFPWEGGGLVGQVARQKKLMEIEDIPAGYLQVASSLGSSGPHSIVLMPLIHNQTVAGVLELGAFTPFSPLQKSFLTQAATPIAIAMNAAQARMSLEEALNGAQRLTEELQVQQEELRVANEELEEQTQQLQTSEEQLKAQQEELQAANEELEEKTISLEERQKNLAQKNSELLLAQQRLEQKARELEEANRYKSEFLANMSHELRTPLNSLLILSQDLSTNKHGRLDPGEVESARLIHSSGQDLLRLINEILDLSKIAAGKMELTISKVPVINIGERLLKNFRHMAEAKGLELNLDLDPNSPEFLYTDAHRLEQILKNLLSNAIKFTDHGSVSIKIFPPTPKVVFERNDLASDQVVAFMVADTGIGIPRNKLQEIFQAFQQVDGSISRKYGGTGLGLSISKELAQLLGGELQVDSQPGLGSTFTLYLPFVYERRAKPQVPLTITAPDPVVSESRLVTNLPAPALEDDRETLASGDKVILIVEDDLVFAQILAGLCHERHFKFVHAGDGETALNLIERYAPVAVLLDIRLPGMHGLKLLDILKSNRDLRHLPVHVISVEECGQEVFQRGAIGFLNKPTSRKELTGIIEKIEADVSSRIRTLLIVEDDPAQQKSIVSLIGNGDVESMVASSGQEALEALRSGKVDCMILDLKLPDMSGFELLNQMDSLEDVPVPPVIIYTGEELSREDEAKLQHYASSIIIKGAYSPERLLDETSLFLHRIVAKLPAHQQRMIDSLYEDDSNFTGKKILLVDDDMRNVFAISKVLEDRGVKVLKAANGQKALDLLEKEEDVNLVLMDIMMPVMDGYETMQRIRRQAKYQKLPILALTAKAMREDRQKCIAAGANDYLAKPVDIKKLCSLLRVWLYR